MDITAINGAASPDHAPSSYTSCGQMSKKVQKANNVTVRAQRRDCKMRQGQTQRPRERPLSTAATSNVTQRSHQRRWSIDTSVIIVRKNKKGPQPPQRGASLLRPQTTPHSSFKRYSCPPIGLLTSPSQSSSSSSSTSSSCSSPPPVQTSVITGHDPLGWKIQPKSRSSSASTRTKRLSLQIPLPVIPDFSSPGSEPSPKTKPPLKPKPSRRHHSESSAFLRSLGNPLPVTKPEELLAVHLRRVVLADDPDDVFDEETQAQRTPADRRGKIPPPVPDKTAMARQIAQLIARSQQRCNPVTAMGSKSKGVHTGGMTPKHPHQTVGRKNIHATTMTALHLNISCDRERTTPRFPG